MKGLTVIIRERNKERAEAARKAEQELREQFSGMMYMSPPRSAIEEKRAWLDANYPEFLVHEAVVMDNTIDKAIVMYKDTNILHIVDVEGLEVKSEIKSNRVQG